MGDRRSITAASWRNPSQRQSGSYGASSRTCRPNAAVARTDWKSTSGEHRARPSLGDNRHVGPTAIVSGYKKRQRPLVKG